jgi:hypothetical protein
VRRGNKINILEKWAEIHLAFRNARRNHFDRLADSESLFVFGFAERWRLGHGEQDDLFARDGTYVVMKT